MNEENNQTPTAPAVGSSDLLHVSEEQLNALRDKMRSDLDNELEARRKLSKSAKEHAAARKRYKASQGKWLEAYEQRERELVKA